MLDFVKLLRPQFLIAGLALNVLGTAIALHLGATMDWIMFAAIQTVISSLQLIGACANELADVDSDRLNMNRTWFSGGSGMVSSGRIEVKTVVSTLYFLVALTFATSLALMFVLETGPIPLLMIVLGLSLAVSYSLGPLRTSYRGLGEISMAFMVSFLTPVTSFYVMYGAYHSMIVLATSPIVFQLLGLMMVVEIPDIEADSAAGKRNLVVRMGTANSWRLGVLMLILGGATAFAAGLLGLPSLAAALAGSVLLVESLVFWILGKVPDSKSKASRSTAISCGFYVVVILLISGAVAAAQQGG